MFESQPANKAIQQERGRLRVRKPRGEDHPREWSDVAREASEARESGQEVQCGMILGFAVEKNADSPQGGPRREHTVEWCSRGSSVKNQNWENAVFSSVGSSPSSMEAGRLVDAYGLREGYDRQQCDAVQAYVRAERRGEPI